MVSKTRQDSVTRSMREADIHHKQSLLILATIPFVVMLWHNHGKPWVEAVISEIGLPEQDYSDRCDIIHENALPNRKCDTYEQESPYFHG